MDSEPNFRRTPVECWSKEASSVSIKPDLCSENYIVMHFFEQGQSSVRLCICLRITSLSVEQSCFSKEIGRDLMCIFTLGDQWM
jgi:hypothetical protein